MRTLLLALLLAGPQEEPPVEFSCPMDPDIRAKSPGKCSRCGMALEARIPPLVEYPVEMRYQKNELRLRVLHPDSRRPVERFQIIHEKPFHLFVISQDLEFFAHEHPIPAGKGAFRLKLPLPKPGFYRLLSDFYPEGGSPQMVPLSLLTGPLGPKPKLQADLALKQTTNLQVSLTTEPPEPLAGKKTLLFFRLDPAEGLEPLLGAWGHLLAASDDLIDLIHTHPALADGGPQVQFNLIFPREAVYRLWVQFQRRGQVNTAVFTVPVTRLR